MAKGKVVPFGRAPGRTDDHGGDSGRRTEEQKIDAGAIRDAVVDDAPVWSDDHGEVWADVEIRGRLDSVKLTSREFRRWLRMKLRERGWPPQKPSEIKLAIAELDAWGAMHGPQHTTHLRVAHRDGAVYVDLAEGRAIRVTARGWDVVTDPPIRFARGPSTLTLPDPFAGGSVDDLRELVNAEDDAQWMLMVGWLVSVYSPGPYPLLVLQGQQDRGKSTTMDALRTVVDPDRVTRATRPKSARDLWVAGQKRWVLSLDNLSGLSDDLSDALCVMSTGGAAVERRLYSNGGEVIHERMGPAIACGIDDIATRGDLMSRSIILELPRIRSRRTEANLRARLASIAPRVLGAVLDATACALARLGSYASQARMADHVAWVEAVAPVLGWQPGEYDRVYQAAQADAYHREIDRNPVARAIVYYVATAGELVGTSAAIMIELDGRADARTKRDPKWPRGVEAWSHAIRRVAPALRAVGIDADQGDGRQRRVWTIRAI